MHLLFDAADGAGDLELPIGRGRAVNQIGGADRPQAVTEAVLQFNTSDPGYRPLTPGTDLENAITSR